MKFKQICNMKIHIEKYDLYVPLYQININFTKNYVTHSRSAQRSTVSTLPRDCRLRNGEIYPHSCLRSGSTVR